MKFPYIFSQISELFIFLPCLFYHSFYLYMSLFLIFFSGPFEGLFFYTSLYLILLSENFLRIRAFSYLIIVQSSDFGHLTLMQ